MDRNRLAIVIVLVASVAVVGVVARRDRGTAETPRGAGTPEDVIHDLHRRASGGDVKGYLACHGEPLRSELAKNERRLGREGFADYLRRTESGVKGFAIAPRGGTASPDAVRREYEVTLVFSDRNEVQYYTLERSGGRWLVTVITASEYQKPARPYNSPVVPEGVPSVQPSRG